MVRIINRKKGESTIDEMNILASFLMTHELADEDFKNSGFQATSTALCDYEVHVIKKRGGESIPQTTAFLEMAEQSEQSLN